MPINYSNDLMNGAQLALRAAGISDERMRTSLLQKFQESQMANQELQRQHLMAQMQNEATTQKLLQTPMSQFMTPEMANVPAPLPGQGQGMYRPGATVQQPTGRMNFEIPPNTPLALAQVLMNVKKEMTPPKWEPTSMPEAIAFEQAKQKPPSLGTEAELWKGVLRESLGREPTMTEVQQKIYEMAKGFPTAQEAFTEAQKMVSAAGPDAGLVPSYEIGPQNKFIPKVQPNITLRIPPWTQATNLPPGIRFNRKDGTFSDQTGKKYTDTELKENFGEMAAFGALKSSLLVQEKSYGMMDGFIQNLSTQVDRMKQITQDVKRFDTRLLNVPLVELRRKVKGTAYENIIDMYVTEISTEMGKIASGSSGSIRELSVQTREKWEQIHDNKLPLGEMMKVLEETRHAADIRRTSAKSAIDDTRKRMTEELGLTSSPTAQPPQSQKKRYRYNPNTGQLE